MCRVFESLLLLCCDTCVQLSSNTKSRHPAAIHHFSSAVNNLWHRLTQRQHFQVRVCTVEQPHNCQPLQRKQNWAPRGPLSAWPARLLGGLGGRRGGGPCGGTGHVNTPFKPPCLVGPAQPGSALPSACTGCLWHRESNSMQCSAGSVSPRRSTSSSTRSSRGTPQIKCIPNHTHTSTHLLPTNQSQAHITMKAFALTAMAVLLLAGSAFAQCDDEFCVHCPKTPSKCGACLAGSNRVPLNGKCTCDIGAGFVEIDSEVRAPFWGVLA